MKTFWLIAENVLHLPAIDAGLKHSIVRVHNSRVDATKTARDKFHRHQAAVVVNPNTDRKIVRFVMGSPPNNPIQSPKTIMIDYEAKNELGWNESHMLNLRPARSLEVYHYLVNHPDIGYRIACRLAVWSVVLGTLGATLGLFSLLR